MRRPARHAGRPGRDQRHPVAGPYYIASYTPRQQLVLRRNPNYHGDRPHRLDQIVVALGVDRARPPADRGWQDRQRTRRVPSTLDHDWKRSTVPAAKPRSRDTSGTSQPGARSAMAAHEREPASLLARATAAGGELCDRPPGSGRPGTEIRQREPVLSRVRPRPTTSPSRWPGPRTFISTP